LKCNYLTNCAFRCHTRSWKWAVSTTE